MKPTPSDKAFRVNRGGSYLVDATECVRPAITDRASVTDAPTTVARWLGFRTFRRAREVRP